MKKSVIMGGIITLLLSFFIFNSKLVKISDSENKIETEGESTHWNGIFEKAFESVNCPKPRDPSTLPDSYYKGPLIDTHIHMGILTDNPEMTADEVEGDSLGVTISVDKWICMMNVEGTSKAFVFFPVWEPTIPEHIRIVELAKDKYPSRFIPFINPPYGGDLSPDDNLPTVDANTLKEMLDIRPSLFVGYGEIPFYTEPNDTEWFLDIVSPNSQLFTEIYPVIREYNLLVYFHLGEDNKKVFKEVAVSNPDITFIFHGDGLIDCGPPKCDGTHNKVIEILESSPNVYYGVDELYGGDWLLQESTSKEDFLANFEDYEPLLNHDLAKFKDFIESYPDQVIFGTDRGVAASWDKDPDVAIALNDYIRAFIGKLDPEVQEKFAYKNAERLLATK